VERDTDPAREPGNGAPTDESGKGRTRPCCEGLDEPEEGERGQDWRWRRVEHFSLRGGRDQPLKKDKLSRCH